MKYLHGSGQANAPLKSFGLGMLAVCASLIFTACGEDDCTVAEKPEDCSSGTIAATECPDGTSVKFCVPEDTDVGDSTDSACPKICDGHDNSSSDEE